MDARLRLDSEEKHHTNPTEILLSEIYILREREREREMELRWERKATEKTRETPLGMKCLSH